MQMQHVNRLADPTLQKNSVHFSVPRNITVIIFLGFSTEEDILNRRIYVIFLGYGATFVGYN
jgi:hypothetical protein